MAGPTALFANVGAEEGESWRQAADLPAVRTLVRLWRGLFEPEPVFAWLVHEDACSAWLNTEEAEREAARIGKPLAGAPPAVVRRVHDKAFAVRLAERERLEPRELAGCTHVFDPDQLSDASAVLEEIERQRAAWPEWARAHFALKPRVGSSGRGRVGAPEAVAGALQRLRERGGAVLEPWLERVVDLSAQLYLARDGALTLVGTTELLVSTSGVYRGQRGLVDSRGRVSSDHHFDAHLRDTAVTASAAAAAEGYHGPCGIDAFTFRADDRELLRPLVELNARFTAGHVAIGMLRRNLRALKERAGLTPEAPRAFCFALEPPGDGWPEPAPPALLLPLAADGGRDGPALLIAPDRDALDALLA